MAAPAVVSGSKAEYVRMAVQAAQAQGIPVAGFVAQIQQESGFNPRAGSSAGAQGIAQFMPGTARGLGVDPWNPASALPGAARLMRQEHDKWGSWELALVAYNAGPLWAQRLKSGQVKMTDLPRETQNYVALLAPKYGISSTNPADIIRGTNTGIPTPSHNPQPGEQIVGAVGDALGAVTDVPGRIFAFLASIGLRLVYVIGGAVMMLLGGLVVFRGMAADAVASVAKVAK